MQVYVMGFNFILKNNEAYVNQLITLFGNLRNSLLSEITCTSMFEHQQNISTKIQLVKIL